MTLVTMVGGCIEEGQRENKNIKNELQVTISPETNGEEGNKDIIQNNVKTLVGTAQIHLKILVEDVKVELKELTYKTIIAMGSSGNETGIHMECPNETINDCKGAKERKSWHRYVGILLGITSSMMFALSILIVKIMSSYHPYSVSFWRFQGILLPSIPVLFYCWGVKKQPVFSTLWPLTAPGHLKTLFFLFLRGVCGASAVTLQFYSLQFISMADSSVIAFGTPVFVSLASHVFLGEKSGFVPVICGIITLAGVVTITRPPILTGGDGFDSQTLIGAGLALGCMCCATMTFLFLRYLRQVQFAVMTGYFGFWGSVQASLMALIFAEFQLPRNQNDWLMATALALLTYIGLTCITLASKYEQAAIISLCRTCDILFSYIWQFLFLGVIPDIYSVIGGLIVVSGVVLAAVRKFISELPDDSPTKKRFWILLK